MLNLNRFGIGTEFGIRVREKNSNFYYGFTIQGGVYIDQNIKEFAHSGYVMDMDSKKYFWDIELFKIGYEF